MKESSWVGRPAATQNVTGRVHYSSNKTLLRACDFGQAGVSQLTANSTERRAELGEVALRGLGPLHVARDEAAVTLAGMDPEGPRRLLSAELATFNNRSEIRSDSWRTPTKARPKSLEGALREAPLMVVTEAYDLFPFVLKAASLPVVTRAVPRNDRGDFLHHPVY